MGSVLKWRRKKISKHKYRKRLKKTRWQRKHP
ncbi:MAG: AURKAIP1/COX24 domain-containing protein [Chloroflexota bacterium]|nr:AURKAIP1/COX24 domain-containing protein [Chloroflexota bacterium]